MAQRRMINKDDYYNRNFWNLTVEQRFLYQSILLFADDDGIIPTAFVKTQCFPFGIGINDNIEGDLIQLEMYGFIILYASNDYAQVMNWWDKQFIDKKIYKKTIHPTPPNYFHRPIDLKKYKTGVLEESKEEEIKTDHISLEGNSRASKLDYPEFPLDD